MDKLKASMFEWLVLGMGIWVAVSPIFLGAAGTIVFYGNVVAGVILMILALRGLTSNGKKYKYNAKNKDIQHSLLRILQNGEGLL